MIEGVKIKNLLIHKDVPDLDQPDVKPGFLMEILRNDEEIFSKFGQSTFTVAYPGTIKAFHWHKKQDDMWFVAAGRAAIVLFDMREDSATFGRVEVIYAGEDDYKLVSIPVGVAHGYKVVSDNPVLLLYHTTESYDVDDPDEHRISYDDERANVDWESL